MNKFKIGDKVLINRNDKRTSKELLEGLRLDNPRTIVAIFYDKGTQHTRYYLGSNYRGEVDLESVPFRASQLTLWVKGKIGHPKVKRPYISTTAVGKGLQA